MKTQSMTMKFFRSLRRLRRRCLLPLLAGAVLAVSFFARPASGSSLEFGSFGGEPLFLQHFGNMTFGNIGSRPFFSQSFGNMTFGRLGKEPFFVQRFGTPSLGAGALGEEWGW